MCKRNETEGIPDHRTELDDDTNDGETDSLHLHQRSCVRAIKTKRGGLRSNDEGRVKGCDDRKDKDDRAEGPGRVKHCSQLAHGSKEKERAVCCPSNNQRM